MDKKIEELNIMVLRFCKDETILVKNSMAELRLLEEAKFLKVLHVILITRQKIDSDIIKLGENVFVYPVKKSIWDFFEIFRIIKKEIIWRGALNAHFILTDSVDMTGYLASFFAKFYKRRLVVILNKNPLTLRGIRYFFRKKIANAVLKRSFRIEVPSKNFVSALSAKGIDPKRITVLPLFFGSQIARQEVIRSIRDIHPNSFIIAYKHEEDNIEATYQVMIILKRLSFKFPNLKLGFISREEDGRVNSRAEKIGIKDKIFWETDAKNRIDFLKTSHAYLENHFDPINLQAIESFLCGLPIVTINSGLPPEILRDTPYARFMATDNSGDSLTQIMQFLIEHPAVRDDYRLNIKDIALTWTSSSYEEYVQALKKDWEEIAALV